MKRIIKKLFAPIAVLTLALGVGLTESRVGQEVKAAENIVLGIDSGYSGEADGTTAWTTTSSQTSTYGSKTLLQTLNNGGTTVSSITGTAKVYPAGTDSGVTGKLKVGNSKVGGWSLKFTLSNSAQASGVILNAKSFGTDTGISISVNSSSAQTITSSFADYTFSFGAANEINIAPGAGKRFYLAGITIIPAAVSRTLQSIAITSEPTDKSYYVGETFNTSGLVVTGTYDTAPLTENVTSQCTIQPANGYTFVSGDISANKVVTVSLSPASSKTFTISVAAAPSLSSIAISGSMTKTNYYTEDSWNPAGLAVTGTYSDSSTADVTSSVSWSYNPATPSSTSITSVEITASIGAITDSVSETVNVTVAPLVGGIVDGHAYLITASTGTQNYILKASTSYAAGGSGSYTEMFSSPASYTLSDAFVFTRIGANKYEINAGSNYLYSTATNNGLALGAKSDSWTAIETGTEYDGIFLQDTNSSRYLTLYETTPNFRTYTSTTGQALPRACIVLYDITALEGFASSFNTAIGAVCDADGATNVSTLATAWANQAAAFNGLTDTQKAVFADLGAEGDVAGTTMQKAIAKYEYVAAKYNTQLKATGWDFMNRNIAPVSGSSSTLFNTLNDSSVVWLIVIISLVSVTTIAGTFYLRKRKYN